MPVYVNLASALGEAGRGDEARMAVEEIKKLDPGFTVDRYMKRISYRDADAMSRFRQGLLDAGLNQ